MGAEGWHHAVHPSLFQLETTSWKMSSFIKGNLEMESLTVLAHYLIMEESNTWESSIEVIVKVRVVFIIGEKLKQQSG